MKKITLLLSLCLVLFSCKKEELSNNTNQDDVRTKHYVSFGDDIENGYCKINGVVKQTFNLSTNGPIYECYSGDVLEYYDSGVTSFEPPIFDSNGVLIDPGSTYNSFVSGYIIVDAIIVKSYYGEDKADLTYIIP